ncbi:fimbrial protein [Pinirhizobacter soli]|uniref:fimbrial protein n=1 Tax=Pinirhizobacter soli TaxID=2786953 RepID=UPI002029EA12|nr:fimbrial protein [Pinirhizobacter soli]
MNRIRIIASLGLLLCTSAIQAQTLNFNLTGTITPGVCRFTTADVDLGTFATTSFTAIGSTTTFVDVPITSSGCDPLVTSIHMRVTGNADAANTNLFRGVTGIGIQLQRTTGAVAIVPAGTTLDFSPVTSGNTYNFRARFMRSATTMAAGSVSSPITINVTYN